MTCALTHVNHPEVISSQLTPESVLTLFAQWTSRVCSASFSKLAGLLGCFFSILPTASHSLPLLPVLCLLPYFTDPKVESIFPFLSNSREQQAHRTWQAPSPSPRSLLLWEHTLWCTTCHMQTSTPNITTWAVIEKQESNTKHFTDFRGFTNLTKCHTFYQKKRWLVATCEKDMLCTEYLLVI